MDNKRQVLWISPYAPYDKVAHAGGKSHNFFVKYFQKSGMFDITLLSLCLKTEEKYLDLDDYGISNNIFVMDKTKAAYLLRIGISGFAFRNPYHSYGGTCLPYERYQMKKLIKDYKNSKKVPEIVILQWTFSLMFVDLIKKLFPESKIIAIEEDVTFLNYERRKKNAESNIERFFWKKRFSIMKEIELEKLKKVNLIVTNNPKDTKLLVDNHISDKYIYTAAPYIDDYSCVERKQIKKDIVFFGAMSRAENYLSAIWFIQRVLPLIQDKEIRFVIIGGNPNQSLYQYECERVVIKGFVENVAEYFSTCMCLVAPLVGGAGIKVKILEAMSAGVPVLTNHIGIEGINAVDKQDYYHCEMPEDYAFYINEMTTNQLESEKMGEHAKQFIKNNYNLPKKLDEMLGRILR